MPDQTTDTDGVRRRALIALVGLPASALALSAAATQFIAWKLNYDRILGPPVIERVYWPWRAVEWSLAPWEPVFDQTFTLAKLGLGGVLGLVLMGAMKAKSRKPVKHPTLHGSAHHLTEGEVRATDLLPDPRNPRPGIIVGGWTDRRGHLRYLMHAGVDHALCLGPTRSGKTASVLIPTLLTWPFSLVVYDPKGELWQRTAGWRQKEAGNIVMRFAPADVNDTIRWNPFDRVRVGTPYEYRDIANIIEQVADPKGKGLTDHWEPTAANFLVGVALHTFRTVNGCSLSAMLDLIDDPASEATMLLKAMTESPYKQIAQVGRGMLNTPDRERGSVISTARRLLRLYRDPVVARNTGFSHFNIDDLMDADRPVSLYIETRGEDELRMRPLVRLFLTLAVGQLISKPPALVGGEEVIPHKWRMLLAIDELASLGELEPLELALSKSAGAGITGLLLGQDHEQIVKTYGTHETITAHCKVTTAFAPNNHATAEWLSKACGQATEVVEEVTESFSSGKRSHNRSYRSSPRALMTPDEIKRLKPAEKDRDGKIVAPGDLIILIGGQVIRGTQSLAFRDPEFSRRMAIPAPPTMRINP
jgi:type IV secretion system protein VirD4